MAMAGPQSSNFHVRASFTALEVLEEDPYFQEALPANWLDIIRKIREKLLPKEQRAQFEEKLSALTEVNEDYEDVKAALPDAIKHLITALNNTPCAHSSESELGRTYLPSNLRNPKLTSQQRLRPIATCREEERLEEPHRHRPLLRPVH
jgi:hypothetical protein